MNRSIAAIPIILGLCILFLGKGLFAVEATGDSFAYSSRISFSDLPATVEGLLPIGMNLEQVEIFLTKRPELILDGAILEITAPLRGSTRSLLLRRLVLKNHSQIITHNIDLQIVAAEIISEGGEIISFPPPSAPKPAEPGQNGEAGLKSGTLLLDAELREGDVLHVLLAGQDGQDGGNGFQGPQGVRGLRGDNGADHLFDCARGGGDGGNGSPGGPGGNGGAGGAGGNGGQLVLRGQIAMQRAQLDFAAPGGRGGAGGSAGLGGPGGEGGPGGRGTTYCRSGRDGVSGPSGPTGAPGARGNDGDKGAISISE